MSMNFDQIIELIKTVSDSKVTNFTYEEGDQLIQIKSGEKKATQVVQVPVAQPAMAAPIAMAPQVMMPQAELAAPIATAAQAEAAPVEENLKLVKSPLVGTFYSAPSPDDAPFISVGDTVKKGQVIGIVEAMKLMNEIESEYDGVVAEIMVNNKDMVEYGQTLIKIK